MKAKDYQAMKRRFYRLDDMAKMLIEREIDRAVRKARRELTARGTECPLCGWKPKRSKGAGR